MISIKGDPPEVRCKSALQVITVGGAQGTPPCCHVRRKHRLQVVWRNANELSKLGKECWKTYASCVVSTVASLEYLLRSLGVGLRIAPKVARNILSAEKRQEQYGMEAGPARRDLSIMRLKITVGRYHHGKGEFAEHHRVLGATFMHCHWVSRGGDHVALPKPSVGRGQTEYLGIRQGRSLP